MGTRAAAQGNYDEAIANLSKAAEVAELYGNVAALKKANTILAKVYQAQGGTAFNNKDYAAAAEIFAKGYAADPKNTQMALWLGTCYCELKDYDKGMEILEKVAGMQGPKFEADAAEANRLLTLYTNNRVAELPDRQRSGAASSPWPTRCWNRTLPTHWRRRYVCRLTSRRRITPR